MSSQSIPKPLYYDRRSRRLWIRGQRCHHGATGALLVSLGAMALGGRHRVAAMALTAGGLLMAHDWKDRTHWFVRGWQEDGG